MAGSIPHNVFSSVDLPHPLAPTNAVMLPWLNVPDSGGYSTMLVAYHQLIQQDHQLAAHHVSITSIITRMAVSTTRSHAGQVISVPKRKKMGDVFIKNQIKCYNITIKIS